MRIMRLVTLVAVMTAVLAAGCAHAPTVGLVEAQQAPEAPWLVRMDGCGHCGATWTGDAMLLGRDGTVLWFMTEGHAGDQDTFAPDSVRHRILIGDALAALRHVEAPWVQGGVHVAETRVFAVEPGWPQLARDLGPAATRVGAQDPPPPIQEHGCQDCTAPWLARLPGPVGGPVMPRGSHGPGTGNVDPDGDWARIEEALAGLHAQARISGGR